MVDRGRQRVLGIEGDSAAVAASLADRLGSIYTVVTNGADGVICWHHGDADTGASHTHPHRRPAGSGDAFTAGVIDGLVDGDIGEGLRCGSVLAAMAPATRGDQVGVTRPELMQLLDPGARGSIADDP